MVTAACVGARDSAVDVHDHHLAAAQPTSALHLVHRSGCKGRQPVAQHLVCVAPGKEARRCDHKLRDRALLGWVAAWFTCCDVVEIRTAVHVWPRPAGRAYVIDPEIQRVSAIPAHFRPEFSPGHCTRCSREKLTAKEVSSGQQGRGSRFYPEKHTYARRCQMSTGAKKRPVSVVH